jgi:hypothetical protein
VQHTIRLLMPVPRSKGRSGPGPPSSPSSPSPPSALPSPAARALAFVAIVVAGACGGLIGWAIVDLQCHGACGGPRALGALGGATAAAVGVAVIAVLVLRAMGEWKAITAPADGADGPGGDVSPG